MHDLNFPLQIDGLGQLSTVQGPKRWRQQIRSVLLTGCAWQRSSNFLGGQRLMRPMFGCRLQYLLHGPLSEETAALAESLLLEDLQASLPHVPLVDIRTQLKGQDAADAKEPSLTFTLQFATPQGQSMEPMELTLAHHSVSLCDERYECSFNEAKNP